MGKLVKENEVQVCMEVVKEEGMRPQLWFPKSVLFPGLVKGSLAMVLL